MTTTEMTEHFRNYRCELCVNLDARCGQCRQRKAQEQRAERASRVARGLCRHCASPAMPGVKLCADHLGLITAPIPESATDLSAEREVRLAEKRVIDSEIASIRSQLDDFDARGVSDAAARARAHVGLTQRGRRSQILQQRIGELSRALRRVEHESRMKERGNSADSDERRFVNAARTVLDRETYLRIWALVNEGKNE